MTINDQNFDEQIKNSNKPVLVDFFATWCGPCTVLGPMLEKIAEEFKDKITLVKVDVNEMPIIAGKFEVDRIPMVSLFINGKQVDTFIGLKPESDIKKWITDILKDNIQSSPQEIDNVIKISEEYAKESGIKLNSDKKTVERIVKGLLLNEGKYGEKYCPCRRITGDKETDKKIICPCIYHKEEIEKDGHCFCNLFVK
jgi:thioredoxin